MEKVISYIEYEKISDTMLYLGNSVSLKFNIKLAKKGMDGRRYHFHKEYQYPSSYINSNNNITIKRDFEYFLSLESSKDQNFFCIITVNDILLVRAILNNVAKWINGSIKTYGIKNNKLVLYGKHDPIEVQLSTGKSLSFEPVVITNANDIQSQGIRLGIDKLYADISANNFMGLVYLIQTIDMFSSAQVMLNYMCGNPFIGVNTYSFCEDTQEETIQTKAGRFPPNNGGSFFTNKLDDM